MYNIRIKQLPKNGDQRNYSLVDRNDLYIKVNPINQDSNVKNTISAVPREEANIEAEGGETVIGDINNDGFLEHNKIVGKRHTEGGVPLNVAPGSFIFSDTKKLKIKDPEVLSIFGITNIPKGGITPAKIANKYPMNNYMNIMKDDSNDPISKRTASKMLENSLEKLGMLALVQESMKGFPDGIPAIAESVMAGMQGPEMQGAPQEMMEGQETSEEGEMRYGGVAKYQNAGTTTQTQKSRPPKIGDTYYVNGKPVKISEVELDTEGDILPDWMNDPSGVYFSPSGSTDYNDKNKKYYLTFDEFKKLRSTPEESLKKSGRTASSWWTADDNRQYNFGVKPNKAPARTYNKRVYNQGDTFENADPDRRAIVINPQYGVGEKNPLLNPKRFLGIGSQYDETMLMNMIDKQGKIIGKNEVIRLDQLDSFLNSGFVVRPNENLQNDGYVPPSATNQQQVSNPATKGAQPLDTTLVEQDRTQRVVIKEDNAGAAPRRTQKAPVNIAPKNTNKAPATSSGIPVEYTNDFEYGGSLPEHQGTNQGVPSTVQPPKEKTIVKWQVSNTTGKKRPVYSDGTIGEPIEYNVADEDLRAQVGAKGYDFFDLPEDLRYKQKTVGPQTAQTGYKLDPESGFLYKDIKPGTRGLDEYMKIHADAINAYPGGAEKWKQDQIAGKGKANPAMKHLLEYENAAIGTLSGNKPYIDMSIEGALVPGVENYNLPGIRKKAPVVTNENKQTVPEKKDIVARQIQYQTIGRKKRPWWLQDQVNFAGYMTDNVFKDSPAMAQVDLETPGYALEDPARQIAAIQENSAANREALMNTTAGNVAGASMASQSPSDLSNVANVIGNVQNRNVGTYNQASNIGAQINNQEQILNSNAEQKYIADSATANQQYANALRDLKWNRIKAFNQGTSNFQRTNQLESMFPQYGFDRMTGDIAFAGGREAYDAQGNPLYDPYINPFGSTDKSSGSGYLSGTELATLKKQYIDAGFSEQQAIDLIKEQTGRASSSSRTRQNSVANAVVSGQTLPQQIGRYGGYMKQYGGTVFDFGALPLYFFED